jgi:hypothetical protein
MAGEDVMLKKDALAVCALNFINYVFYNYS